MLLHLDYRYRFSMPRLERRSFYLLSAVGLAFLLYEVGKRNTQIVNN